MSRARVTQLVDLGLQAAGERDRWPHVPTEDSISAR